MHAYMDSDDPGAPMHTSIQFIYDDKMHGGNTPLCTIISKEEIPRCTSGIVNIHQYITHTPWSSLYMLYWSEEEIPRCTRVVYTRGVRRKYPAALVGFVHASNPPPRLEMCYVRPKVRLSTRFRRFIQLLLSVPPP